MIEVPDLGAVELSEHSGHVQELLSEHVDNDIFILAKDVYGKVVHSFDLLDLRYRCGCIDPYKLRAIVC